MSISQSPSDPALLCHMYEWVLNNERHVRLLFTNNDNYINIYVQGKISVLREVHSRVSSSEGSPAQTQIDRASSAWASKGKILSTECWVMNR